VCRSCGFTYRFTEEDTAVDYFGDQLLAAGYNYYGNEPMYSGITGQEFAADIYIGVVYYQRLRHMVLDKFQVRTTGPVDPVTRQPVKVRLSNASTYLRVHPLSRVVNVPAVFVSVRWSATR
jgi:DNA-directed RNA polymerase beta subunit